MRKKIKLIYVLIAVFIFLFGCSERNEELNDGKQVYSVYYLNSSVTRLISHDYRTETTDPEELAAELMAQLRKVPNDLDCQTVLSDKVGFYDLKKEQMVLYLYFDNNYTSMSPAQEILCRAALAKTMTQISGIDFINIYAGDQPLLNKSGNPVGMLSNSDFIESVSDVNAFEKIELVLFFSNETGDKLVQEKREVVHNINTSVEKLIVDELIGGPRNQNLQPTLNSGIKVLNVSVNENVCYINFDSSFLTTSTNVSDYMTIYSIVNSLSELSTVNKVQITVEGSQDIMYRDSISLNTLFERNLDYIEEGTK